MISFLILFLRNLEKTVRFTGLFSYLHLVLNRYFAMNFISNYMFTF